MNIPRSVEVAVLLATYNGARFIEAQLKSLKENGCAFKLHWLDDQSTDDTREAVRATAAALGIEIREWHQPQRQGVPGAYFQLLECVDDADIYLFCDQDDIWQPGKIDATVANLLPDLSAPVLCFSDCLVFDDQRPGALQRVSDVLDMKGPAALQESRSFMSTPAAGHTMGFTHRLREIYLAHKDIARSHAFMHDWWMYIIAHASGVCRLLPDVPTTLYRQHGSNTTGAFLKRGIGQLAATWRLQQMLRRAVSRQAQGFVLAATSLPPGPKLERLVCLARLVSTVDRRQSPVALLRLALNQAMWPNRRRAAWLTAACLYSDAKP